MMTWPQHQKIQDAASEFVRFARRTGATIRTDTDICGLLGAVTDAARLNRSTRAFDHAPRPRGKNENGNPAEEAAVDRMAMIHAHIARAAERSDDDEDRKFLGKLLQAVAAYRNRTRDRDLSDGRSMRDQTRQLAQDPWPLWERDATSDGRRRLNRDRRLAARATDRRIPVPFLGAAPAPGSDLERLESQAAESFALL